MEKSLYKIDFNVNNSSSVIGFYSPQFIISTTTSLAMKNFIDIFDKYNSKIKFELNDIKINKIVDIKNIIEEKL